MKSVDYQSVFSLDEIEEVARQLIGVDILKYDVVTFIGDLGSGKTTLIKSLAREMGVKDNISSPTFSIVNEYCGEKSPIYHIDLYRLKNVYEAIDIGIEEYLYGDGVCMIEWPQIILKICPYPHIKIEIENMGKFTRRLHAYEITEPL